MVILVGRIYDVPNWKVVSDDEIVNNFFNHFMNLIRRIDYHFDENGMKFDVTIRGDNENPVYEFRFMITERYRAHVYYSTLNNKWSIGVSEIDDIITDKPHSTYNFPRMEAVIQKLVEYIIWH